VPQALLVILEQLVQQVQLAHKDQQVQLVLQAQPAL
jgi:hypothetical protein